MENQEEKGDAPLIDELDVREDTQDEEQLTEEEKEIRKRAIALHDQIIEKEGPEFIEGLKDYFKLPATLGVQVAIDLLKFMINKSKAGKSKRKILCNKLDNVSDIKDHGCMRVDFFDIIEKKPNVGYIALFICDKEHDFGKELDKFQKRMNEEQYGSLKNHIGQLVFLGRMAFNMILKQNPEFSEEIKKYFNKIEHFESLRVDPKNTTLFLFPELSQRIGVRSFIGDEYTITMEDGSCDHQK